MGAAPTDAVDRVLLDLLDLPADFHRRKGVRTLVIFDEFQDVLQAGDGVDAVIRSRIQHQRQVASYVFAGSHPGMLDELFGNRNRPLFDQARPLELEPLGALTVAEYVEERFQRTSRSAGPALDQLVELADGHPQRVMMLAHHLWEHTPPGEHATDEAWSAAMRGVFSDLQEQYERAWSVEMKQIDRQILDAVARGCTELLGAKVLKGLSAGKTTVARARDRLVQAGDLRRDGSGGVRLVDPLYAAWIRSGRQPPRSPVRRPISPEADGLLPFGASDGARASLGELGRAYVEVGGSVGGVRALRSIRVVVGRKGAGKTLLLRRQRASLIQDPSVYVADSDYTAPMTAEVVEVAHMYPRHLLTETWSSIWRVALLRTVISHLATPKLGGFSLDAPDVLPPLRGPASLGSQVGQILRDHPSRAALDSYIRHPEWERVEHAVGDALRDTRPLYLFFDALDEEFRHAPAFWLAAQKGLFFRLMRMQADQRLGARLHVSMALRDLSYASLLASEHSTRYVDNPFVRVLRWDEESIGRLLAEKIRVLGSGSLVKPESGSGVEGWLGHAKMSSPDRDSPEPMREYLLRHTRLLPRDLVVLGNELCGLAFDAVGAGQSAVDPERIHGVVTRNARLFGQEQLAICANQISAELVPDGAEREGYIGVYTGEDRSRYGLAYVSAVEKDLGEALRSVGIDRFGAGEMEALREELSNSFGDMAVGLSALWQNGLLGYVEDGASPIFYGMSAHDELQMPLHAHAYALHPTAVYALGLPRFTA